MSTVLGVIPARGGSKSVPRKNIRDLCGKPLLAYAIASSRAARRLDRFVVSTDDPEIAAVAANCGAEVIDRPPELATDTAPTAWALIHAVDELLRRDGFRPDIVLTLEPTSPFRSAATIDRCIELMDSTDADSVIGVEETRACFGKMMNGRFAFLTPNPPRRRQDREPLYRESSTIYATRTEVLRARSSTFGDRLYGLVIPPEEVWDINDPVDFEIAETLMRRYRKENAPHG